MTRRTDALILIAAVALAASGCGPRAGDATGTSGGTSDAEASGPGDGPDAGSTATGSGAGFEIASLLFVVDNSATMPPRQAKLAEAVVGLASLLDEAEIDFRIAVTTTDNGNSFWCSSTTPEHGAFVLSSCLERPEDFEIGPLVESDPTCVESCSVDQVILRPTPIDTSPDAVRPWIEVRDGVSNIENATLAEALPCTLLQGLQGCGFEQPLESMLRAIERTQDPTAPELGFFGPGTLPVVVILTDELDCSVDPMHEEAVFSPEGPKTFWTLPDRPSPATCWNAGVTCDEAWNCEPADLDPFGQPASPQQAVMFPVERYSQALSELATTVGGEALLTAIVGVAPDGSLPYGPADDPDVQAEYGIAPICGEPFYDPAIPTVRIRDFVNDAGGTLSSVCADSYEPTLQALVSAIVERMEGS